MSRACASGKNVNPDSVALVNRQGTPITGNKSRTAARSRCGDKCIVRGAAGHAVGGQPKNEILVGACTEPQEGLGKSCAQKFADHVAGSPMRSGQAGKHGIGLQRAVLDKTQSAVKHPSRALVILVPRRECGHH